MSMYYFHLHNDDDLVDTDGTDLPDVRAARSHANGVARELMFKSDGLLGQDWSRWSMTINDEAGVELFSFVLSDTKTNDDFE